jgi:hypothetical protein
MNRTAAAAAAVVVVVVKVVVAVVVVVVVVVFLLLIELSLRKYEHGTINFITVPYLSDSLPLKECSLTLVLQPWFTIYQTPQRSNPRERSRMKLLPQKPTNESSVIHCALKDTRLNYSTVPFFSPALPLIRLSTASILDYISIVFPSPLKESRHHRVSTSPYFRRGDKT